MNTQNPEVALLGLLSDEAFTKMALELEPKLT